MNTEYTEKQLQTEQLYKELGIGFRVYALGQPIEDELTGRIALFD